jgi:hypothetical protein
VSTHILVRRRRAAEHPRLGRGERRITHLHFDSSCPAVYTQIRAGLYDNAVHVWEKSIMLNQPSARV